MAPNIEYGSEHRIWTPNINTGCPLSLHSGTATLHTVPLIHGLAVKTVNWDMCTVYPCHHGTARGTCDTVVPRSPVQGDQGVRYRETRESGTGSLGLGA